MAYPVIEQWANLVLAASRMERQGSGGGSQAGESLGDSWPKRRGRRNRTEWPQAFTGVRLAGLETTVIIGQFGISEEKSPGRASLEM